MKTHEKYRKLRERAGSQTEVARALEAAGDLSGPWPSTLSKRENGALAISGEAMLAMRYLAEHPELVG